MTEKEKELLLKDLCARLPYGVKYQTYLGDIFTLKDITLSRTSTEYYIDDNAFSLEQIKPYLRTMSSMTEDEKTQVQRFMDIVTNENYGDGYSPSAWDAMNDFVQYYDSHYLDHRGLIFRGLALEAPEGMYNF